jgi:hypothetical protein
MKNKFLKIRRFYQGIGRVWCPVLKEYIDFNKAGFRHLVRKKGILRSHKEQKRRFTLLAYAEEIIGDPQAQYSYEETFKEAIIARFWSFAATKNDFMVTVIIRQLKNGKKHFFSIYAKKQKSTR